MKRIAIVPAYNEERNIGRVVDELRAFDPELDVVVVSDGSVDNTTSSARITACAAPSGASPTA